MFFDFDPRRGGGANGRLGADSAPPSMEKALEGKGDGAEGPEGDFAREVDEAADARAVERALTNAASRVSGLGSARLVPLQRRGLDPGLEVASVAAHPGARVWGWLVVDESADRLGDRDEPVRRRLATLGMIAGGALDRLEARARANPPAPAHRRFEMEPTPTQTTKREPNSPRAGEGAKPPAPGIHDETFLHAVMPLFFNQAKRHAEPLSILYLAIDRLDAIRALLGAEQADRTTIGVGRLIASRIRSSDFVARLNDDRLVVVLPRADFDGALVVARKLRRIAAEEGARLSEAPELTISIGAASFPSSASELADLHDAADSALSAAQGLGRNRVETAPPRAQGHALAPATGEV